MLRKEQLLESMVRDCEVSKHLFSKLPAESMHYRPTPDQRSTQELLQYLAICGIVGAKCMATDDWSLYAPFAERSQQMEATDFPAAMDRQISELREVFSSLTEEALESQEVAVPGGGKMPLGAGILNGPAKWLNAYKMQLFLYAKASGASELNTANVWAGVDPEPSKAS